MSQAIDAVGNPDGDAVVVVPMVGIAGERSYPPAQQFSWQRLPAAVPSESPSASPAAIAIRVYRGNTTTLLGDSAVLYGGPGGWGTYRLALGIAGNGNVWMPGATLRVALAENGVEVRSTTVTIPALTYAAVEVTAADLVGQ